MTLLRAETARFPPGPRGFPQLKTPSHDSLPRQRDGKRVEGNLPRDLKLESVGELGGQVKLRYDGRLGLLFDRAGLGALR